ncbi:peptidase inhibitor family I36 protein [Streptomyces sp. WAC 01325]|uniref:peptidase inhibitor family I36 protein n=1 Tax=Streptomyces sp. WAC 01325 TaxID=2203202 RepID=UPI00163CEA82|nr:peptidase inhibitor family I36 protein [Streptomyces sp. WAC 01325]
MTKKIRNITIAAVVTLAATVAVSASVETGSRDIRPLGKTNKVAVQDANAAPQGHLLICAQPNPSQVNAGNSCVSVEAADATVPDVEGRFGDTFRNSRLIVSNMSDRDFCFHTAENFGGSVISAPAGATTETLDTLNSPIASFRECQNPGSSRAGATMETLPDPGAEAHDRTNKTLTESDRIAACQDDAICLYEGENYTGQMILFRFNSISQPGVPSNLTDLKFANGTRVDKNVRSVVNKIANKACWFLEKDAASSQVNWPTGRFIRHDERISKIEAIYSSLIFYAEGSFQCGKA